MKDEITEEIQYYDNTRVGAYKTCPRMYYFRHVRHWRTKGTSPALAFGSAWHAAMDTVWHYHGTGTDANLLEAAITSWRDTMIEEGIDIDNPTYSLNNVRTEGTALEMLATYIKRNARILNEIELIAIEQPFAVPLSEAESPMYVGRRDKIFRHQGRINVCEHKTTSAYKKGGPFRSTWMDSFSPNSQVDGYSYATFLEYGDEFKGVWIDAALVHKTVHDGFRFIPIERLFSMLDAWLWETRGWIKKIQEDHDRLMTYLIGCETRPEFLPAFAKNTDNCAMYAGCSYKNLCRFLTNPASQIEPPEGFIEEKWSPFDILQLERIGLDKPRGED